MDTYCNKKFGGHDWESHVYDMIPSNSDHELASLPMMSEASSWPWHLVQTVAIPQKQGPHTHTHTIVFLPRENPASNFRYTYSPNSHNLQTTSFWTFYFHHNLWAQNQLNHQYHCSHSLGHLLTYLFIFETSGYPFLRRHQMWFRRQDLPTSNYLWAAGIGIHP